MPEEAGPPISVEEENRIMHSSLPIGGDTIIMGSDTGGEWTSSIIKGNNFSISINTHSKDEADRLFQGLSAGGQVSMPMGPTFWGDYFSMFTDGFGINWMVSLKENKPG